MTDGMKGKEAGQAALGIVAVCAAALLLTSCDRKPVAPLPELKLDPQRVAVAGFSSGAIMAQQAHLAFSDRLIGAVLLSGPPYQCAEGSLDLALSRCMKANAPGLDAQRLAARTVERAARGQLAPIEGLAGDRVVVVRGTQDALVPEVVARASLGFYEALPVADRMSLRWDGDGKFAHVWPTLDAGGECGTTISPYVGSCGRDLAGEAMRELFGPPRQAATVAAGSLTTFAQRAFDPGSDPHVDDIGYLYQPPQCTGDRRCGLLVAFHGCEQNAANVGEAFVRDAGFNRWADMHDVVVLYPQTRASYMPLNPKACWDWWGYSGTDYDTRKGVQLRWLANVTAALGVPLGE